MSLDAYRHRRLIVQNARTSAFDAARAMRTNDVGAIVVVDKAAVVGIVTDRDLALRVVGEGRDPRATALKEIMSRHVAALAPDASESDAVRVMRERRVRRVPMVEAERLVGMVTLDDLILERAATPDELSAIVRAQIHVGGPAQTRRFDEWRALERRYARALQTWGRVVARVQTRSGLATREQAERAIEVVLGALVRRLEPPLAKRLIARAPAVLQGRLTELASGPDRSVTRDAIERRLAAVFSVDVPSARSILDAVGASLSRSVQPMGVIGQRLPDELRSVFRGRAPQGRRGARRPSSRARG